MDGHTWTALDARRGISLPAGEHRVTVRCLQCPEGVQTSVKKVIIVPSGGTATELLTFPEAP